MDTIIKSYWQKMRQAVNMYRKNHTMENYNAYILARDNYRTIKNSTG
jgi:hypothetical protein